MSIYQIQLSDGSVSDMQILDPNTTVEDEIAKWGNPIMRPIDYTNPESALQPVTVVNIIQIS